MRRVFRFFLTVLSVPFLVVLYQNIENYAQSRGWDGLLSRHFPAMSDFLMQTWVITVAALFAGAALGAWIHHLLPMPQPTGSKDNKDLKGPCLPPIVYSTEWANGISMMPIQDAACALCGIEQDGFASLPRARAIANDLVGAASTGWVCSEDAHYHLMQKPIGGCSVVIAGKPRFPAVEEASITTRIYTPSLLDDYVKNHKDLHVDWIPTSEDKDYTVIIEAM